jgi:phosphocarrier protein HPr
MTETTLKITNPTGLHARPAALFVQKAAEFASQVRISANSKVADAKSILSVMGLGLACGAEIVLSAEGQDEQECIEELTALFQSNFGER